MALTFQLARTIDYSGGFVADANPNTTSPAVGDVFPVPLRTTGQSEDAATRSILAYVRLLTKSTGAEVTAGTATYTVWARDDGASTGTSATNAGKPRFASGASHATVPSSQYVQEKALGKIFVQITAVSLGGADTAEVWIAASSSS